MCAQYGPCDALSGTRNSTAGGTGGGGGKWGAPGLHTQASPGGAVGMHPCPGASCPYTARAFHATARHVIHTRDILDLPLRTAMEL